MAAKSTKKMAKSTAKKTEKKPAPSRSLWGLGTESLLVRTLQTERKTGQKGACVLVTPGKKGGVVSRTVEGTDSIEIFLNPLAATEGENTRA